MNAEELITRFNNTAGGLIIFVAIAIIIFCALLWYYFAYFAYSLKKDKVLPKGKVKYKYCVLIPARNEDKVIANILESLKNQTYPKELFDVYVIVESKDDPSVKIVKKYKYNVFIRKDLINKRTKGYALDEVYQYIRKENKEYDAFIIFDADNVASNDYVDLMNDVKNAGYKVGMGYRNFTNGSANRISATSATLFAYMNQYTSKGRSRLFKKMTLTGTGYFVDKDIIDFEGEWIFNGMTEDVELTKYCYYHNIPMKYYPIAQYYDEQATKLSVIHKQHIRWVWGYFKDDKRFKIKNVDYGALSKGLMKASLFEFNVSIYPFVAMTIMLFLAVLFSLALFIASIVYCFFYQEFMNQLVPLSMFFWVVIYYVCLNLPFSFAALITFIISNKYLKFSLWTRIRVCLTYLYFFGDFVTAFVDGLFHKYKRTTWDKIAHEGKISNKDALRNLNNENK